MEDKMRKSHIKRAKLKVFQTIKIERAYSISKLLKI